MYSHYTPQSDGTYRRNTIPSQKQASFVPGVHQYPSDSLQQSPVQAPSEAPKTIRNNPGDSSQSNGILSFFKKLMPEKIDSDDLLIILMVLLMNRDEENSSLSPLLTLALYFLL